MINVEDNIDDAKVVDRMSSNSSREVQKYVCFVFGRFFHEIVFSFNITNSPLYVNIIRAIGQCLRPTSMCDLRTWVLKEMNNVEKSIDGIMRTWN